MKQPFEVIGVISYDNPGKYQVLNLGDAIEPLKAKAREVGGNGIIIDKSHAEHSSQLRAIADRARVGCSLGTARVDTVL